MAGTKSATRTRSSPPSFYLAINRDVSTAGVNPLTHFDQSGWKEGRLPSIAFDTSRYLMANPDIAAAHIDPLNHFLSTGAGEGRQPIALSSLLAANGFDFAYYLQSNPDVAASGIDPFWHFQSIGWHEGRNPNALFDIKGYLASYGDVAAAGVNPLDHYNASGWREGRDPSPGFDTSAYLAGNPDVAAANINPLNHYLQAGMDEGRFSPSPTDCGDRALLRRRHALHPPLRDQRAQRGGLERLVQHLDVARARFLAHQRRAVGGDQDRRQVGAEAPAQRRDRLDAVAASRGDSRPAGRSAPPWRRSPRRARPSGPAP